MFALKAANICSFCS